MSILVGHERDMAIADLLDRALNKGVVLSGEATISLAGVDLIYVGLKVLVASYETASRIRDSQAAAAPLPDERGTQ
jgi:gas vesicle structural protein